MTTFDCEHCADGDALRDGEECAYCAADTPLVGLIIDFENGELDEDETVALFQRLLDSGMVWHLQGSYQRMLYNLIDAGRVVPV